MIVSSLKLPAALAVMLSLACAGPAWSASTPTKKAAVVSKQKVKAKTTPKIKAAPAAQSSVSSTPAVVAATVATVALPAVVMASETVTAPPATGYVPSRPAASTNPYLANQTAMAMPNPVDNVAQIVNNLKAALPSIPEGGSILPSIKKVYPTGEKPLVVVTFKCPTELIGITPIPTKLLHEGVNGVMDVINATNLLSFNLQQVCQ